MAKYKAIISDVDGTLMVQGKRGFMNENPTSKVRDAVIKAQKILHFGIATSRSPSFSYHLFDYLKLSGPSILHDGSIILDTGTRKILWEKQLIKKDLFEVIKILSRLKVEFIIDERNESEIAYTKTYTPGHPLNIFASELTNEMAQTIEKELSHISTINLHKVPSWTNSLWGFNITNSEASKQHAVLEVAKILGIKTHEIIGIGNGYNDFSLLMACGLKVAMEDSVDDLKEIADYIAPSVEKDGIVDVIEKFVL